MAKVFFCYGPQAQPRYLAQLTKEQGFKVLNNWEWPNHEQNEKITPLMKERDYADFGHSLCEVMDDANLVVFDSRICSNSKEALSQLGYCTPAAVNMQKTIVIVAERGTCLDTMASLYGHTRTYTYEEFIKRLPKPGTLGGG